MRVQMLYVLIICLGDVSFINGFWDDRDYHDDLDDESDPDELPDDWRNRIDPAIMNESLSAPNGSRTLENDIMFADASVGLDSSNVTGSLPLVLWPNGKIPYQMSQQFGSPDQFLIHEAMAIIERKTFHCVTFTARQAEANFIHFLPGENCSSYVGMRADGGMQPVFLDPARCIQMGIIQHEILHALGLFHEHSRSDRNASVIIYENEIMNSHKSQYRIIPNMPTFGTDYDLNSLMHYGPYDFAKSTDHPVIIPRQKGIYRMGQRDGLSVRDAAKLRNAYKCQVSQEDQETDEGEQSFPGFSTAPMTAEQCALQFNGYCSNPSVNRDNCSHDTVFYIQCNESAMYTDVHATTAALAKAPLRPLIIWLMWRHVTPSILSPVDKQIISLATETCLVRNPTAILPRFSFINLQQLMLINCWDMRIKKSDFQSLLKLQVIIFNHATILYLEKGTFTNLPELKIIAWHHNLSTAFGKSVADGINSIPYFVQSQIDYLKRIHCGCQFGWLRKWLKQKNMLKAVPSRSVLFYGAEWGNIGIAQNDVYIPLDCAAQPFPVDFTMINFTQKEFSLHEPLCLAGTYNATYESFKFRRPFSGTRIDPTQCIMQFGRSCKPNKFISPSPDEREAMITKTDYCRKLYRSSLRSLQISCWSNTTVREMQEISFALAKPPIRRVDVSLSDGDYIVYRAFAPIRAQILVLYLYDCVDSYPTAKLADLSLGNLMSLVVHNCPDILVQAEDFNAVPNLFTLLFNNSTVNGMNPSVFAALSNLRIISLEFDASKMLSTPSPSAYHQYLQKLHCGCEFRQYRRWLQSQLIDHMRIWYAVDMVHSKVSAKSVCSKKIPSSGAIIIPIAFEEFEVGIPQQWMCYRKDALYLPVDCANAQNNSVRTAVNVHQRNYSINVPPCEKQVKPEASLLTAPASQECCADRKPAHYADFALMEGWTAGLSQPILQERRSELTAKAVDAAGRLYYYDDQMLSGDPTFESASSPKNRIWSENGTINVLLLMYLLPWRESEVGMWKFSAGNR
ncbi:uncharacterized protein LOC129597392 [Paramacrobiotus metropolitanus]|uniref:uncharacterized protein LOC129597392 n=1 Tax=Paramacrobiotus metropolitanus TaxID=2943436 RepID=UPI002445B89F|nr:uncharacterized protein LOC129597392 [Paramacrobiotus metropolitanus]